MLKNNEYLNKLVFKKNKNLTFGYNLKRKTICCMVLNLNIEKKDLNLKNIDTFYIENNFLNIKLKIQAILKFLNLKEFENKKIHIEHTSANPVGCLHLGNLRNAYVGDVMKRLNLYKGNKVITEYYVNDMGTACAASILCYLKHPELKLDELYLYYAQNKNEFDQIEINNILDALENSTKYNTLLNKIKKYNLNLILTDLKKINIFFDEFIFESNIHKKLKKYDSELETKFIKENNLIYYNAENNIKHIIRKSTGTYTYLARDLIHSLEKTNKNYDIYYVFLGQDHQLFRDNFLKIFNILKNTNFKIELVPIVTFKTEKMSKRKNNILFLKDIQNFKNLKLIFASTNKNIDVATVNVKTKILDLIENIDLNFNYNLKTNIDFYEIFFILVKFKLKLKTINYLQIYNFFEEFMLCLNLKITPQENNQNNLVNNNYAKTIKKFISDFKYILNL